MRVELICSKLFLIHLFFRITFNGRSRQLKTITKMLLKLSKVSLMNLTKEENPIGVSLLIDTGFARFL